jgi:zinc transport system ATP-binding protein
MAQLTAQNLSLGYDGSVVLRGLNFTVNEGDYLCIVGENGSGKSTLVKTLLGLQPPEGGTITTGDGLRQREIGYLPQQTSVQRDFPASVMEIVLSGCLNRCGHRAFYNKAEKETALANLNRMGAVHLKNRCYRELSGGQQQRVLLARALCSAQKMLLLDEPVSGLDPKATAELYEVIESLNKNHGITILMISHDIASALHKASHVLHVGEKVFFGTLEEYMKSEIGKMFSAEGDSQ